MSKETIDAFTLGEQAFHHGRLRPYIGRTGKVVFRSKEGAIAQVLFPGAPAPIAVTLSLGQQHRVERLDLGDGKLIGSSAAEYSGPARTFQVELPLPPLAVSPNQRPHRMAKANATATYRDVCRQLYVEAGIPPLRAPIRVSLDYYLCRRRADQPIARWGGLYDPTLFAYPRDEDNARACSKAAQDALQDAGVIPGDGHKFVQAGHTRLHTTAATHQGRTCLVVTLTELTGEDAGLSTTKNAAAA